MNIKKIFFLPLLIISINSFAQKKLMYVDYDSAYYNGFSIGTHHLGIGIGNFTKYNGLHLNWLDKDTCDNGISIGIGQYFGFNVKKTNGLELSLFTQLDHLNGISISPLMSDLNNVNGISFTGGINSTVKINGVSFSGIASLQDSINGISLNLILNRSEVVNGIVFSGLVQNVDTLLNGIAISGLFLNAHRYNGACISPINITDEAVGIQIGIINKANSLRGIQFGLININKRKKHFKILPILNFSL